eukprot:1738841-Rhodomonas_salina.4
MSLLHRERMSGTYPGSALALALRSREYLRLVGACATPPSSVCLRRLRRALCGVPWEYLGSLPGLPATTHFGEKLTMHFRGQPDPLLTNLASALVPECGLRVLHIRNCALLLEVREQSSLGHIPSRAGGRVTVERPLSERHARSRLRQELREYSGQEGVRIHCLWKNSVSVARWRKCRHHFTSIPEW